MEILEANGLTGVTLITEQVEAVRQWVQDRAVQGEIVVQTVPPIRMYLPVGVNGMAQVDEGDTIWWDPEGGVNAFSLERA